VKKKKKFVRSMMRDGKGGLYYEYPLFDQHRLCPSARYVGGTSKYLCECGYPQLCEGVIAVMRKYGEETD